MGTCGQKDRFNLRLFLDAFREQLEHMGEQRTDTRNNRNNGHNRDTKNKDYGKKTSVDSFVAQNRPKTCPFCAQQHSAFECKLTPEDKFNAIRSKKLCGNCFGPHYFKECHNKGRCRTCNKSHHTSLHDYFANKYSQNTTNTACAVIPKRSNLINSQVDSVTQNVKPATVDLKMNLPETPTPELAMNHANLKSDGKTFDINSSTVLLETGYVTLTNEGKQTSPGILAYNGCNIQVILQYFTI